MRKAIVILSVLLAAFLGLHGVFDNEAMYGIIHADAQGYYGYLIAIFIERSFDWEQVINSYSVVYFNGGGADFTVQSDLGRINKYYAGTAVLILPFFLLTCVAAWFFGFPVDGYSEPFQIGIIFSALFYAGLGIYFLSKFLESKGIRRGTSLVSSVLMLFATNLFHYCISEPAMSHAYSFGLICAFMFYVDKWLTDATWKNLAWTSVIFGLIVLVRPVNGLVLFSLPFIAGGFGALWDKLRTSKGLAVQLGVGVILVFSVLVLQSVMYLAQVGKPLVWSYQDEGFNLLDPEIMNVLFSYRKGFFVYTPIAFLGALGIGWFSFKKPKSGIWLMFFLAVVVYIISSWWNWYYGGSFGHRAMIEYLPFFAFGLAYLIQISSKSIRAGIITVCGFFVAVNMIQSYQYQKFILHWVGMDKDRFWEVFLKTDRKYDGIFYKRDMTLYTKTFETDLEPGTEWSEQGINTERSYSGKHSTVVGGGNIYGSTIGIPVSEIGDGKRLELRISAMVWCQKEQQELTLAYSYRNDSTDYGHTYIQLGQLVTTSGRWMEINKVEPLVLPAAINDTWIIYPFSNGPTPVFLDDLKYEVVALKE